MKSVSALVFAAALLGSTTVGGAQTLPAYMGPISGPVTATPADTATKDMLALNTTMFELYGDAGKIFQANILAKHPVILGLFSGAGGRFTLYRPGQPPLEAPQVPIVYQLLKSVGHSTMALAEVVGPYLENPANKSWRGAMLAYRSRMQSALDGLDATPIQADWRDNNRTILQNKVAHWMTVLTDWKRMLDADWDKTYAASNTIYVARQNNVLFSTLAQFFPPEAINDRLLLIETVSFTTTQADMLESLTRIIADRSVGSLFFGNYHLMDYELMGGDARAAIIAETGKRGMTPNLPPVVPFGSHQWPALVTPGPGPGSIADLK
jgi:hypothetical protein